MVDPKTLKIPTVQVSNQELLRKLSIQLQEAEYLQQGIKIGVSEYLKDAETITNEQKAYLKVVDDFVKDLRETKRKVEEENASVSVAAMEDIQTSLENMKTQVDRFKEMFPETMARWQNQPGANG